MLQHLHLEARPPLSAAIDTALSTVVGGHLRPQALRLWALFLLAALMFAAGNQDDVTAWRQDREAKLKASDGWLSVAGLVWLKPGETTVGSAPVNGIVLPKRAPVHAGVVTFRSGQVTFTPTKGSAISMKPNSQDFIAVGDIHLLLIERGGMLGIRIKDNQSSTRKSFTGLQWFPYREDWVIQARFVPYDRPRELLFDAQAGGKQKMTAPGYVEFEQGGRKLRLTPILDGEGWEFVFRDATAGKSTYSAARFLDVAPAENGRLTLDFNRAYNPPCVFTPYATCPLPPPENRLAVAVEAGEKMYGKHN